jgi:SPP1 gp7 family putative phage head morphogenesis protein
MRAQRRMMPLSLRARLQENKQRLQGKVVAIPQKRNVNGAKVRYNRNMVNQVITPMLNDVANSLPKVLRATEAEYIGDNYALSINSVITTLAKRYRDIGPLANRIAQDMTEDINASSRASFYKAMEKAVGVNLNGAIREEGVYEIIQAKTIENVGLIQSLPDEYFKQLITVVNESATRGFSAKEIEKEIKHLGSKAKKRAKLIARDQTQKVNAAITESRQRGMGVVKYRWRTSGLENVRPTHKAHNGKVFRWDSPPKDTGHPGQDIQCQCTAEAIIDLDDF